jgi:outer membrane protein assembly factor BamB
MPVKTKPNPNSAVVWDYAAKDRNNNGRIEGEEKVNRSMSTVVVYNGLVFCPDLSGFLHVFDAKTGQHHWTHDMESAMWGSPMAADGKVYLCDEEGDVAIFEAAKDKKVIANINMGTAIYGSPVLANGTLYIMTKEKLFAIGGKK